MQIETLHLPLTPDAQGTLRIADTRVTLDVVVDAFAQGATPEAIVQDFPTLRLPDVYAVLTYCLQHPGAVEAYLHRRRDEADALRQRLETRIDVHDLRARLRARHGA